MWQLQLGDGFALYQPKRAEKQKMHFISNKKIILQSVSSQINMFFSMCAGDEAQPHGEPDHASSVVLRLRQRSFPGAKTQSSLVSRQHQTAPLTTERHHSGKRPFFCF